MRTHVKEALATLGAVALIVSLVHAGIWFTLFGVPDFSVLGFPFHYFWFVAGAPFAMFVVYWGYFKFITLRVQPEKDEMKTTAEKEVGAGEPAVTTEVGGDEDD